MAGGGAGQHDHTAGYIAATNVFNDTCALNANPEDGTTTAAGANTRQVWNSGAGMTEGYGSCPILYGACCTYETSSGETRYGGFGGGGVPWDGGGGAGWSGGRFNNSYPSYGGTSHVDPSGINVTRRIAPIDLGYTVPGHVTLELLGSPEKKILAKDSEILTDLNTIFQIQILGLY